jgi:hypothetical protein
MIVEFLPAQVGSGGSGGSRNIIDERQAHLRKPCLGCRGKKEGAHSTIPGGDDTSQQKCTRGPSALLQKCLPA